MTVKKRQKRRDTPKPPTREEFLLQTDRYDLIKNRSKMASRIDVIQTEQGEEDFCIFVEEWPQLLHTFTSRQFCRHVTHYQRLDADMFYVITCTHTVLQWQFKKNGRHVQTQTIPFPFVMMCMIFIKESGVYVAVDKHQNLVVLVYSKAKQRIEVLKFIETVYTATSLTFIRDTREVIVAGTGLLRSYAVLQGKELSAKIAEGKDIKSSLRKLEIIRRLSVDPVNRRLLVVTVTRLVMIDYMTMTEIKQFTDSDKENPGTITCCCIYKNNEYLITGSNSGLVKVWNPLLYTEIHVFKGHHAAVTEILTTEKEALLFSASEDGWVCIWRIDVLREQPMQKLKVGVEVISMGLNSGSCNLGFWCYTPNELVVYEYIRLTVDYADVDSTVYKLQRLHGFGDHPNRILAASEDGGIRHLNPVTGSLIGYMFPMTTLKLVQHIAYDPFRRRMYLLMSPGSVLVLNCAHVPFRSEKVCEPRCHDDDVTCMASALLNLGHDLEDVVIFTGFRNGQIYLLCPEYFVMCRSVKAHHAKVECLEPMSGVTPEGDRLYWTTRVLVSAGADFTIKLWLLVCKPHPSVGLDLRLELLIEIRCDLPPKFVSATSDRVCAVFYNSFVVDMYDVSQLEKTATPTSVPLQIKHTPDYDHTATITALKKCTLLRIFATASLDRTIKIWNEDNQLVRELIFLKPVMDICFATDLGDLLSASGKIIQLTSPEKYLPWSYLEKLKTKDFESVEEREMGMIFRLSTKSWIDPNTVKKTRLPLPGEVMKEVDEEHCTDREELEVVFVSVRGRATKIRIPLTILRRKQKRSRRRFQAYYSETDLPPSSVRRPIKIIDPRGSSLTAATGQLLTSDGVSVLDSESLVLDSISIVPKYSDTGQRRKIKWESEEDLREKSPAMEEAETPGKGESPAKGEPVTEGQLAETGGASPQEKQVTLRTGVKLHFSRAMEEEKKRTGVPEVVSPSSTSERSSSVSEYHHEQMDSLDEGARELFEGLGLSSTAVPREYGILQGRQESVTETEDEEEEEEEEHEEGQETEKEKSHEEEEQHLKEASPAAKQRLTLRQYMERRGFVSEVPSENPKEQCLKQLEMFMARIEEFDIDDDRRKFLIHIGEKFRENVLSAKSGEEMDEMADKFLREVFKMKIPPHPRKTSNRKPSVSPPPPPAEVEVEEMPKPVVVKALSQQKVRRKIEPLNVPIVVENKTSAYLKEKYKKGTGAGQKKEKQKKKKSEVQDDIKQIQIMLDHMGILPLVEEILQTLREQPWFPKNVADGFVPTMIAWLALMKPPFDRRVLQQAIIYTLDVIKSNDFPAVLDDKLMMAIRQGLSALPTGACLKVFKDLAEMLNPDEVESLTKYLFRTADVSTRKKAGDIVKNAFFKRGITEYTIDLGQSVSPESQAPRSPATRSPVVLLKRRRPSAKQPVPVAKRAAAVQRPAGKKTPAEKKTGSRKTRRRSTHAPGDLFAESKDAGQEIRAERTSEVGRPPSIEGTETLLDYTMQLPQTPAVESEADQGDAQERAHHMFFPEKAPFVPLDTDTVSEKTSSKEKEASLHHTKEHKKVHAAAYGSSRRDSHPDHKKAHDTDDRFSDLVTLACQRDEKETDVKPGTESTKGDEQHLQPELLTVEGARDTKSRKTSQKIPDSPGEKRSIVKVRQRVPSPQIEHVSSEGKEKPHSTSSVESLPHSIGAFSQLPISYPGSPAMTSTQTSSFSPAKSDTSEATAPREDGGLPYPQYAYDTADWLTERSITVPIPFSIPSAPRKPEFEKELRPIEQRLQRVSIRIETQLPTEAQTRMATGEDPGVTRLSIPPSEAEARRVAAAESRTSRTKFVPSKVELRMAGPSKLELVPEKGMKSPKVSATQVTPQTVEQISESSTKQQTGPHPEEPSDLKAVEGGAHSARPISDLGVVPHPTPAPSFEMGETHPQHRLEKDELPTVVIPSKKTQRATSLTQPPRLSLTREEAEVLPKIERLKFLKDKYNPDVSASQEDECKMELYERWLWLEHEAHDIKTYPQTAPLFHEKPSSAQRKTDGLDTETLDADQQERTWAADAQDEVQRLLRVKRRQKLAKEQQRKVTVFEPADARADYQLLSQASMQTLRALERLWVSSQWQAGEAGIRVARATTVHPDSPPAPDISGPISALDGRLGSVITNRTLGESAYGKLSVHWTSMVPRIPVEGLQRRVRELERKSLHHRTSVSRVPPGLIETTNDQQSPPLFRSRFVASTATKEKRVKLPKIAPIHPPLAGPKGDPLSTMLRHSTFARLPASVQISVLKRLNCSGR